jgi:hypothetical protein
MTSIPSSTPDTTRNDLAAIVERDAASGSIHATPSITTAGTHDAYAPADRRVLLGLLREARARIAHHHPEDKFGPWHDSRRASCADCSLLSRLSVLDDTTRNDR